MSTQERWFLVPFVGFAAFCAAFLTTFALDWLYWSFEYPCRKVQLFDGDCPVEPGGMAIYMDIVGSVGAAIAAIYIVVGCTLMAPEPKAKAALIIYGLGALVAVIMGLSMEWYFPMISALLAGAATAVVMNRKYASTKPI